MSVCAFAPLPQLPNTKLHHAHAPWSWPRPATRRQRRILLHDRLPQLACLSVAQWSRERMKWRSPCTYACYGAGACNCEPSRHTALTSHTMVTSRDPAMQRSAHSATIYNDRIRCAQPADAQCARGSMPAPRHGHAQPLHHAGSQRVPLRRRRAGAAEWGGRGCRLGGTEPGQQRRRVPCCTCCGSRARCYAASMGRRGLTGSGRGTAAAPPPTPPKPCPPASPAPQPPSPGWAAPPAAWRPPCKCAAPCHSSPLLAAPPHQQRAGRRNQQRGAGTARGGGSGGRRSSCRRS